MWKDFTLLLCFASFVFVSQTIQGVPAKVLEDEFLDFSVDVLFVQRKGVRKETLSLDLNEANGSEGTVITSTQLMNRFDWEPGIKTSLCYTPSSLRSVELSLAWVAQWHANLVRYGDDTLRFPFATTDLTQDYNFAWKARASYSSQLWDFEGNYWEHITARGEDYYSISAIGGLRGVYLGERAGLHYVTPPDISHYIAHTKNHLWGIQGGLCIQANPDSHSLWSFELITKVGILANWANASSWLGDVNDEVVTRSTEKTQVKASYLLDEDLRLSYHPRYGLAHIGYRMIGIWNVALATSQLSRSASPNEAAKVANWRAFYHIIYLGFGWVF